MSPSLGVQLLVTLPLEGELGECVCVCTCLTVYLHTEIHTYRPAEIVLIVLFVLSRKSVSATVNSRKPFGEILLQLSLKKTKKQQSKAHTGVIYTALSSKTLALCICFLPDPKVSLKPPAPLSQLEALHSHALGLFPWTMNS